jgi:hypothetical protein
MPFTVHNVIGVHSEWHQLVEWVIFHILQKAFVLLINYARSNFSYKMLQVAFSMLFWAKSIN